MPEMISKVQIASDTNPFVKLGADIESKIVSILDITSAINYLIASNRTADQANKYGWKFIIDQVKSISKKTLPDSLTVVNLPIFQQHFQESQKNFQMITNFLETEKTKPLTMAYWTRNINCFASLIRYVLDAVKKLDRVFSSMMQNANQLWVEIGYHDQYLSMIFDDISELANNKDRYHEIILHFGRKLKETYSFLKRSN